MNLPETFTDSPPFEWDYRVASVIERVFGNTTEPTNTVATIKRLAGRVTVADRVEEVDFDRIKVDLDINTSPKNEIERFDENAVDAFFRETFVWQDAFEKEIQTFLKAD